MQSASDDHARSAAVLDHRAFIAFKADGRGQFKHICVDASTPATANTAPTPTAGFDRRDRVSGTGDGPVRATVLFGRPSGTGDCPVAATPSAATTASSPSPSRAPSVIKPPSKRTAGKFFNGLLDHRAFNGNRKAGSILRHKEDRSESRGQHFAVHRDRSNSNEKQVAPGCQAASTPCRKKRATAITPQAPLAKTECFHPMRHADASCLAPAAIPVGAEVGSRPPFRRRGSARRSVPNVADLAFLPPTARSPTSQAFR